MRRHEDLCLITGRGRYTRILALYSSRYNQMRTHLALRKDAPLRRAIRIRNHHYHTNSVRIASSLRADMIFGKDRMSAFWMATTPAAAAADPVSAARVAALRDCGWMSDDDWAYAYRACMAQHGQQE